MNDDSRSVQRIREEILAFRRRFDSLVLATVSADAAPEASAAPMICGADGEFYVFVSALAAHTGNLRGNPQAGVLLIEPAEQAQNAFARRRLTYQCRAETVARDAPVFAAVLQRFAQRFGDIVETLKALPDFELVRLTPVSGTYVRGFGQAWRLGGEAMNEPEHINPARDGKR